MGGYDVAVVGGGSAGCVLAARLSEDGGRRVLLLEAGPDYASRAALPVDLADGRQPAYSHDWGYTSEPDDAGRSISLPRGRVMGGCSSTNACIALRGSPADYDAWAAAGNKGWAFADVLPYFCAAEADADYPNEEHGTEGPLPIHRFRDANMSPWSAAFLEAAILAGHSEVADHNSPWAVGAGPVPTNESNGLRVSTAVAYLAGARHRTNLTIRAGAAVDRIVFDGRGAAGVRLAAGEVVEAGTVVLAAGAYGSPAILLRSGIGPAGELAALGVQVVAALPGVGLGLLDHPIVSVDGPVGGGDWDGGRFQTVLTVPSRGRGSNAAPDLQVFASGPWESGTERVFGLVLSLLKPRSRGRLRLRSADPHASPAIDVAHLREASDRARLAELVTAARELWRQPPLANLSVGSEIRPGTAVGAADLEAWVAANAETCHHPTGTCRMGPDPDAGAVVDAEGRVYGVEGLRVADASIMPDIPSANTNLPTIMVAERMAAFLRASEASDDAGRG
ncbi:MAG: GMC family oxidoreductase N-terminal domain-containing protein [Candidatus Dormibacteraeota bacterium]|nr:GMC family oxidoreductase N-terminal domain-containing protein [Candidatus Dormibacteraeota bacterium]